MTRIRSTGGADHGAASVLVVGLIATILTLTAGALVVASAVVASHRARAAADLAALAAAASLLDDSDGSRACAAAGRVARANGAALQGCSSSDGAAVTASVAVSVVVSVTVPAALWPGPAVARSRAGTEGR